MITECTRAVVESMTSNMNSDIRREAYASVAAGILALIVSILIIAFAGQWLWNNVIVDLFTCVKPSRSIWMLIGLKIFLLLILP